MVNLGLMMDHLERHWRSWLKNYHYEYWLAQLVLTFIHGMKMKHLSNYENMLWNIKHPKDEHNPSSLVHWRNDIKWSIEIMEYLNFMLCFFFKSWRSSHYLFNYWIDWCIYSLISHGVPHNLFQVETTIFVLRPKTLNKKSWFSKNYLNLPKANP